jgi:hypothetical protein
MSASLPAVILEMVELNFSHFEYFGEINILAITLGCVDHTCDIARNDGFKVPTNMIPFISS